MCAIGWARGCGSPSTTASTSDGGIDNAAALGAGSTGAAVAAGSPGVGSVGRVGRLGASEAGAVTIAAARPGVDWMVGFDPSVSTGDTTGNEGAVGAVSNTEPWGAWLSMGWDAPMRG